MSLVKMLAKYESKKSGKIVYNVTNCILDELGFEKQNPDLILIGSIKISPRDYIGEQSLEDIYNKLN